jgi:hypothetical protein
MPPQEHQVTRQTSWDENVPDDGQQFAARTNGSAECRYGDTMEHLDPFEPVERRSIFHRESFVMQFASKEGPRAIIILIVCVAMGAGSTVGVVPAVMTDRYARLNHGYDGVMACNDYGIRTKPQACLDGSADAQTATATGSLINNVLTFITSSLMGSLSDEHGRRCEYAMEIDYAAWRENAPFPWISIISLLSQHF